jgi:hypothetical protein
MNKILLYLIIIFSTPQITFCQSLEGYWVFDSKKDTVLLKITKINGSLNPSYFLSEIKTSHEKKIKILIVKNQDSISEIKDMYGNVLCDSVYLRVSENVLILSKENSVQNFRRTTKKRYKKHLRVLRRKNKKKSKGESYNVIDHYDI